MFRKLFNPRDISIKKKLVYLQVLTCMIVLTLCCFAFLIQDIKHYKETKTQSLSSLSKIIGSLSTSALQNADTVSLNTILSELNVQPDILNAGIFNSNGKLIASYTKKGGRPYVFPIPASGLTSAAYKKGNDYLMYDLLKQDGNRIGVACVRADWSDVNKAVRRKIEIGLMLLAISMILTVFIASILQKHISSPIIRLVRLVKKISATTVYNSRASEEGKDEIGELSRGINEMLDQLQKKERNLREKKDQLTSVLESLGEAVLVANTDGEMLLWNRASEEITGVSPEGVPMEKWQQMYGIYLSDTVTPYKMEDLPLARAMKGEEVNNVEVYLKHPDPNRKGIFISVTARPLKSNLGDIRGGVAVFRDITELKYSRDVDKKRISRMARFQETFLELTNLELQLPLNEKLRRIIQLISRIIDVERISLWLFDADRSSISSDNIYLSSKNEFQPGAVLYANDYPRYFLALEIYSVIDANDAQKDTRTYEFTESYLKPNGITSMLDVPIRIGGNVSGIICLEHIGPQRVWTNEEQIYASSIGGIVALVIENHQRVNAEHDLQEMNIQLREAKNIAERSSTGKDLFLANMGHKIRNTPLNAIVGFLQILKETPLNEDQKEIVDSIDSAGRFLLVIINDILDLSEIETGKIVFAKKEMNIGKILDSVVTLMRPQALEKNLKFSVASDYAIPSLVLGDPDRLNQVLINLLTNAIKFTDRGHVKLSTNLLKETATEVICEFIVEDTGIGIPEDKQTEIFEPFSEMKGGSILRKGDTGFGLAISRRLIELQGGRITLKSQPGKGSTLVIQLPFRKTEKVGKPKLPAEKEVSMRKPEPSKSLHILLAEDIELNQNLVSRIFKKTSHVLDIASNGKEVIEKVSSNGFDVILMDIQMPEMDGCQATKVIRNLSDETKRHIPIIALTAYVSKEEGEKYLKLGMDAHIAKPFNQQELFNVIDSLTRDKEKAVPTTTTTTNVPETPFYSLNYLNETGDGDKEFIADMINIFLDSVPQRIEDINRLLEQRDFNQYALVVHKIKNLALPFQMNSTIELTKIIEDNARSEQNMEFLQSKNKELIAMLEKGIDYLKIEMKNLM